jgi:hypothetical protein
MLQQSPVQWRALQPLAAQGRVQPLAAPLEPDLAALHPLPQLVAAAKW